MASAYALNAAGGNATNASGRSNKKKSHHTSNKSWDKNSDTKPTQVAGGGAAGAGQLFPKIGSSASPAPSLPSLPSVAHSGSDSSKPSSNFHGVVVLPLPSNNNNSNLIVQDPSALPKLSGKGSYSSAHSSVTSSSSSAASAATSHPSQSSTNVNSSLPAVSPRTDASAALTVRILNNITGAGTKDKPDQAGKPPKHKEKEKDKEKESKSTKKKKKERRKSEEGATDKSPAPIAVAAVPAPVAAAAAPLDVNDDDDGEYEYDDETYAATSPSSTRKVPAAVVAADPDATIVDNSDSAASPSKDVSSNGQQKKVGPKVQKPRMKPTNDSFSQTSEINEELDANFAATASSSSSSFPMPVTSPSSRAKSNEGPQKEELSMETNSKRSHQQTLHRASHTNSEQEVEEEAQAQLHTTLSPQALRKALQQQTVPHVNANDFSSPAFSRSIGYGSDGFEEEEEENVAALLAGSPASTHRRFPTALSSLQTPQAAGAGTTLKSPAGKMNSQTAAAKANKKKGAINPTPMKSGATAATTLAVNASKSSQQQSSAKKKLLSSANSHGGVKSSSQKSNNGSSPPKAVTTAASAADDPSDNYSDVDWRNETTRDIHAIAQQSDANGGASGERHAWNESVVLSREQSAELPDEVIRFTLMPDTIQSFYAQNAGKLPNHPANGKQSMSSFAKQATSSRGLFNTTLEFSRSTKIDSSEKLSARLAHAAHKPVASSAVGNFAYATEAEGELQCETQWVPVYSTTLAPLDESLPSVFTIDRATFGHDPEESLLIQLWNNAYGDVTDDDEDDNDDTKTDEKKDIGSLPSRSQKSNGTTGSGSGNSNLNRTLLAEFRASFKDLSAQNSYVDPAEATTARRSKTPRMNVPPPVTAVAPRSALKAPKDPNSVNGNNPDHPPPPKLHVRFFDQVEIFRLSDRLDRTLELSGPVVSPAAASSANNRTSPSASGKGNHREKDKEPSSADPIEPLPDLNSLILSEQAFHRRIRMVQTPLVVTGTPNAHNGKNNPILQYPLLPAAKKPAPLKKKASKENDSGEANGVSGSSGTSTPSSHGTPPLPPFLHTKLHVRGSELVPMSFQSGSSNPQLEILLLLPPHGWIMLYKSEVQFNTLEPSFKPVVISFPALSSLTASSTTSVNSSIGTAFTSHQAQAILDAPLVFRLVNFDADMVASSPTAATTSSSTNGAGAAGENIVSGINESLTANGGERMGQAITSLRVLMPSAAAFHTPGHSGASDSVEGANSTLPAPQTFILSNPARQKLSSKRTSCGRLIVNFLPPSTSGPSSSLATGSTAASHSNSRAGSATSSRSHNNNNAVNAKKNFINGSNNNSRPTSKQAVK